MKRHEIEAGSVYRARVTERLVPVKILGESAFGGWVAINMATGRTIHIKSARRLRERISSLPPFRGGRPAAEPTT